MKRQNRPSTFLLLFLFVPVTLAGREFVITPLGQDSSLWCWATCCEMVFDAYKIGTYGTLEDVDQYDIVQWAVDGKNKGNKFSGTNKTVDKVLMKFGMIGSRYISNSAGGILSKAQLSTDEIDRGFPVLAEIGIKKPNLPSYLHCVLILGYSGASGSTMERVIFNDPADGGAKKTMPYDLFKRTGDSWGWFETLRLTTPPRDPIPVGIGNNHRVWLFDDDCTLEITPSTQTLNYHAVKCGDAPVSWDWKLIFIHASGEAVAASWTTTTSQDDLTWSITNLYLPTGYDWNYTYDGKITGRVEVTCFDPDIHKDAITVLYSPATLYPGTLRYKDKTISSTKPEIKAHELLILENDQFNSGASMQFKSGEQIVLEDGVTIKSGSTVTFTVDPSIR